ncbi:MAG: rhodanese-like domain-containing protein [Pseudanabaena sp. M57BS1SP1A06MG]|nr:rhodanese-like domain-containing protein [Pseudanabaena sp. M53BS1SP1A06MG]MCA6582087.1 rhodanese-like domain-containing protein [Pseudanabaena sp. M34BS1SP1A06MG]MCA6592196.1 rhodanese-like domain-containing protein [Pseudanabaena sp. M38BS1SP1A06MG]MCA6599758.1 rhodanese-like domain-containing protein [Pseudanabaena sp. M57BS1SP1A06MG]
MDRQAFQLTKSNFKEFISTRRYLFPLAIVGTMFVVGLGTLSLLAYQQQMSLPVYLQSFSTPQISVNALASSKLRSIVLIDVRSPEEYQEDHIGNSELVPLAEIEIELGIQRIKNIVERYQEQAKIKPTIVLYCTSGMRSIKANKYLSDRGYQVVTLTGGITAWRKQFTRSQDLQVLSEK